jgi:hypothetical protein
MFEWKPVIHRIDMPMDGTVFLAIWKGRISMCQFDGESNFYIIFEPGNYSQCMKIDRDRENKFSHWMPLPPCPKDF